MFSASAGWCVQCQGGPSSQGLLHEQAVGEGLWWALQQPSPAAGGSTGQEVSSLRGTPAVASCVLSLLLLQQTVQYRGQLLAPQLAVLLLVEV